VSGEIVYKPVKIREIMRSLMIAKGAKVRDISAVTELSAQAIYRILQGSRKQPHNDTVKKLADYFAVSPHYLLYGEEDTPAPAVEERLAEIERRLRAFTGREPDGAGDMDAATKQALHDKYVRDGLLALHVDELDDKKKEMLYNLLLELDRG
jgi:transcriptional regulator with XRE-family HTH domain